ncbi:putative membrane protein [Candidatus Jidaibacter acanthamoeba]|uniref:Putative membrane protein n=2 Tax=Candidatus Jidaibacter acanthamoebae TaxID=86105 RepID=A0A0C1QZQ3_9RICK|nr:putative membrane protein [Candidatus Jidaibacter acanthamoeba]
MDIMFSVYFWVGFVAFVLVMLAIDLGVLNKKPKEPKFKEVFFLTIFWIILAFLFGGLIYAYAGSQKAMEFITGYLVELSLSVDNVFVFVLLFNYFKVDIKYQHRVLFWGIVGAIIMRFLMITGGIYLVQHFQWIFYLFGAFLIFSAYKIAFSESEEVEIEDNKLIIFLKRYLRVTNKHHGDKFVVIEKGKRVFTPLFVLLILVEQSDLIFAMDSIPAILAITQDAFIVFTSNIFAILGLRSLYFLLAKVVHKFVYLKYGLSVILAYIGTKMILLVQGVHIPTPLSLGVIILSILVSILLSLNKAKKIE